MTTQSAAAKLTCDQPFFFSGKGEKKRTHSFSPRLQTKREEGPPDRRLLQIRVVQRRFNFRQFDSARDRER